MTTIRVKSGKRGTTIRVRAGKGESLLDFVAALAGEKTSLSKDFHQLYKTGDADAPESVKDRNGEVVLGLCRRCGKGEAELEGDCAPEGGVRDGSNRTTSGAIGQP